MLSKEWPALNEEESNRLATQLAPCLSCPSLLVFKGEIGAGKTTFIRTMLMALGVKGTIKSPTYSLVETYLCQDYNVHHFDLYRIHDESELEYIGFRDYFDEPAIHCIEWPERASSQLILIDLQLTFIVQSDVRHLCIDALSAKGEKILSCLVGKQ